MTIADEAPSSLLDDIAEPCQYATCAEVAAWSWHCIACEPSSVAFCDQHDRAVQSFRDVSCEICGNRCWRVDEGWTRAPI